MKRSAIYLASAMLAAALGLAVSGPVSAAEVSCWYNGALHTCVWYPGYPYEYPPGYGYGAAAAGIGTGLEALVTAPVALAEDVTAGVTEPLLMTGRSVAAGPAPVPGAMAGPGNYCETPVTTCRLREPGWLGTGCSCRVHGGHARGFVQ
jgi:hypothetical protein